MAEDKGSFTYATGKNSPESSSRTVTLYPTSVDAWTKAEIPVSELVKVSIAFFIVVTQYHA